MAQLNVDAELMRDQIRAIDGQLVQMENGCICCTLRPDLVKQLQSLASSQVWDYCIIESTGISEPMQVAKICAV